jgi:hypothetical protein
VSDLLSSKHFEPINSTLDGITIDVSADDENAEDSIRFSCEFGANESSESEAVEANADEAITSHEDGIVIRPIEEP